MHASSFRTIFAAFAAVLVCSSVSWAGGQSSTDQIYFSATTDVETILVNQIKAETVRLDISSWYLSDGSVAEAIADRFNAGVQVRIIGDRASIFEDDPNTKTWFYWLANQGVPIRLRFNPTYYPEIDHWKAAIFVGQNMVEFGSGNFAPSELTPISSTNYDDDSEMFTTDPTLVQAFRTKFDVMWNDTTAEPESIYSPGPPYLKNWNDACAAEPTGNCSDYATQYPNPAPMVINTDRLEPDDTNMPVDLIWGQGPDFNDRLTTEITNEKSHIDLVVYRLTVDNIFQALMSQHQAGVPERIILDINQYLNRSFPEYWLTHANIDALWAAGVPIKQNAHAGVTHMKTLVTSTYATNASSNYAGAWQRDHDYFVSASTKPTIYQALADRVNAMWNDTSGFTDFVPQPPDATNPESPVDNATGVSTTPTLSWSTAPFATSYDVYLGTTSDNMTLVGNVPAVMNPSPPTSYTWTPSSPLAAGTRYDWEIVSRTNATPVNPSIKATSTIFVFTTGGTSGPPPAPSTPSPSDGATGISTTPTLIWSTGAIGTTYNVAFGQTSPPPQQATGVSSSSYNPGTLSATTTYYWQVTAVTSGGSTAGPVWAFMTGTGGGGGTATDVVVHAKDVPSSALHGSWSFVSDSTAADGIMLGTSDEGVANTTNALASPTDYVDVTFSANGGTPYTLWLRVKAFGNSKSNDSLYAQFSDALVNGSSVYQIGSTAGLVVNLATDSTGSSDQGWGWVDGAYWLNQSATVTFANSGSHTIRLQVREDGVEVDQIVLSPTTYFNASASCPTSCAHAPGPVSNDNTIVAESAPNPPAMPTSPSPATNATGVGTTPTLTWTASGATSYDVFFGASNPPGQVTTGQAAASYSPAALANSTAYYWQVVAHNASGATTGPVWTFTTVATAPPPATDVVVYASDVPQAALHGSWTFASDSTAANGVKLATPDNGVANTNNALASPTDYVDVPFTANAGTPYTLWIRVQALNNSKSNDSLYAQFSDALVNGSAAYPVGTTSGLVVNLATDTTGSSLHGWGWANGGYWLTQAATVTFANSGTHTLRIQVREDGVEFDQVVLSPTTYFNASASCPTTCGNAPGPVSNDNTIVQKPTPPPPTPPGTPGSPSPANNATGVTTSPTLTWVSSGATSYDVFFGTSNPPAQVSSGQANASYTPAALANSTAYFWQVVAHNANGTTAGSVWTFTTAASAPPPPSNIVVYAGDVPPSALHGSWALVSDSTAAGGSKLATPDNGVANTNNALATPTDYVDVPFTANAGTPYTLWIRVQALNNSKSNDSLWVQFSDALSNGSSIYPINSTAGLDVNLATDSTGASDQAWGWVDGAYWLNQAATVTFANSGTHTLRIQMREDGVEFDQVVLSPTTYFNASASCPTSCGNAPGPVSNDTTIVAKP